MPVHGEYEPSAQAWVRDQVEQYESSGGTPAHPVWYYNVRANPLVELQDGARKQDMIAREVSGEERAEWWKRAVAAYPPYAEYQEKTTREIPVFVLEPVAS